jgi:hypothetical protein
VGRGRAWRSGPGRTVGGTGSWSTTAILGGKGRLSPRGDTSLLSGRARLTAFVPFVWFGPGAPPKVPSQRAFSARLNSLQIDKRPMGRVADTRPVTEGERPRGKNWIGHCRSHELSAGPECPDLPGDFQDSAGEASVVPRLAKEWPLSRSRSAAVWTVGLRAHFLVSSALCENSQKRPAFPQRPRGGPAKSRERRERGGAEETKRAGRSTYRRAGDGLRHAPARPHTRRPPPCRDARRTAPQRGDPARSTPPGWCSRAGPSVHACLRFDFFAGRGCNSAETRSPQGHERGVRPSHSEHSRCPHSPTPDKEAACAESCSLPGW